MPNWTRCYLIIFQVTILPTLNSCPFERLFRHNDDEHEDPVNLQIGNSKKDPISNNSNRFKAGVASSSGNGGNSSSTAITKRKVVIVNNNENANNNNNENNNDSPENEDDWMKDLSPQQVMHILEGKLKFVVFFYVHHYSFAHRAATFYLGSVWVQYTGIFVISLISHRLLFTFSQKPKIKENILIM